MKKIIALIMAGIMIAGLAQPVYAAGEVVTIAEPETVRTLSVTPKLTIPKLPQIPKLTVKLNYNIDFSKYIPQIVWPPKVE